MTNLDIAQQATLTPIQEVAERAGLGEDDYEPTGRFKAKLTSSGIDRLRQAPKGKLILVTAMTPTTAGEGKTTVAVGLAQGLNRIGRKAVPAIREPALGPVFGVKGGACGGGYSQVLPMEDINLFFNGDFPAVAAAHNLLAAMIDASLHNGNPLGIESRSITWPRTVDMNDRALREIVVALGGKTNGVPRESGFVITPASEVMAVLGLANDLDDLKTRLGRIVIGQGPAGKPITASDLSATGAMTVLLRDAIRPNLVQTIEGGPAIVHGGPFANIAHGTSTVVSTDAALGMSDFVVTEGGFGADLGAEKFLNIVTHALGYGPDVIVLVVTIRAIKFHGGGDDPASLERGMKNVTRHLRHLRHYGPPVIVAINRRPDDSDDDNRQVQDLLAKQHIYAVIADPWGSGGPGCEELALAVEQASDRPRELLRLYEPSDSIEHKLERITHEAYGGDGVILEDEAKRKVKWLTKHGLADLPVCVAKTQYSLSDDPKRINAPQGFKIHIRDIVPSIGAGFLVCIAGEIMLMPGLGKEPAAARIDIDAEGRISGLF